MGSTACFVIVARNDCPIYESELGTAPKVSHPVRTRDVVGVGRIVTFLRKMESVARFCTCNRIVCGRVRWFQFEVFRASWSSKCVHGQ